MKQPWTRILLAFLVCGTGGCAGPGAQSPSTTEDTSGGGIVMRSGADMKCTKAQAIEAAREAMQRKKRAPLDGDGITAVPGYESGKPVWHISCENRVRGGWQAKVDGTTGEVLFAFPVR